MSKVIRLNQSLFPVLIMLIVLVLLAAVFWIGSTRLAATTIDPVGDNYLNVLSGAAYLFLLAGISGLLTAYRQRKKRPARPYSWKLILLLAFIVPLLISWLPGLVVIAATWTTQQYLPPGFFLAGHPWLPIFQAIALIILLLADGEIRLEAPLPAVKTIPWAAAGLWGLGFWLILVFSAHLTASSISISEMFSRSAAPLSTAMATLAGLLLLPLGGEIWFRGRLLSQWQSRYGPIPGSLLSAAVFSLACMRPVLWLPTFIVAIGLNYLTNRSHGLQAPILAHTVINFFSLLVLPALLI
jgi:hypothetical protein